MNPPARDGQPVRAHEFTGAAAGRHAGTRTARCVEHGTCAVVVVRGEV